MKQRRLPIERIHLSARYVRGDGSTVTSLPNSFNGRATSAVLPLNIKARISSVLDPRMEAAWEESDMYSECAGKSVCDLVIPGLEMNSKIISAEVLLRFQQPDGGKS